MCSKLLDYPILLVARLPFRAGGAIITSGKKEKRRGKGRKKKGKKKGKKKEKKEGKDCKESRCRL